MLNIFTTKQASNGINFGDLTLDLSGYIKRTEAATKAEVNALTEVVANKLDASPQHLHHIDDVNELDKALAGKYDTSKQYSYNVILSDSEKIPFLENPQVLSLECTTAKNSKGYKMYMDSGTNDLNIVSPNNAIIGMYSVNSNKWIANVSDQEFSERVYIPASATKYIPQFVSSHSTPRFENITMDDAGACAYSAVLFTVTIRCTNCLENGYTFPKFNNNGKCYFRLFCRCKTGKPGMGIRFVAVVFSRTCLAAVTAVQQPYQFVGIGQLGHAVFIVAHLIHPYV